MKTSYLVAALFVVFTLISSLQAALITMDMVMVGDPNNAAQVSGNADQNGYGAVANEFWIGKYHFTNSQYTAFLNAIDPAGTNPNSVYNVNMGSNARGGISFITGNASGQKYAAKTNMGDKPVNYVSWFDAARVCNWLHKGARTYGSTDATASAPQNTGAYTVGTATDGNSVVKNAGAQFYVPTENEWYKAAYYNPTLNSNAGGYRLYGNGFDSGIAVVTADGTGNGSAGDGSIVGSGTGNFANLNFAAVWNGQPGNVTTVGSNGAASYYGAFDMSGNVWDWNDLDGTPGSTSGVRGGGWGSNASGASSANRETFYPNIDGATIGFRLASRSLGPLLVAEYPDGTTLPSNIAPIALPSLINHTSDVRVYTVRNFGSAVLSDIVVSKYGADSSHFLLTAPATDSLAPGASTTFSVSFAPTSSGSRSAQLSITSNDSNNSPFVINLSGFGLGEDLDTDGDGLNDAAEFTMSALGFDWQIYQPTLVTALYSNANRANLFTQSQYDNNHARGREDGRAEVIEVPGSYGLYDSTSIMDLRMGGLMIRKQGTDATVVFQPQTTTDLATLPFTNNGTPITNAIPMPGDKGFLRVEAIYVPAGDLPSGY